MTKNSDFDSSMIKLLQAHYGQDSIYWRYVPRIDVPAWMCSVDGLSWWLASDRPNLLSNEENK